MDALVQDIDWLAVGTPLVLALGAVLVLLVDAFAGPPRSHRAALVPTALTVLTVVAASLPALVLWDDPRRTFCVADPMRGPELCSFEADRLTLVFWGVALFGTAVVALIGTADVRERRVPMGEWCFLLLCSATGAVTIAAARDLITLVVALEVVSLPAFALAGLRRGDPGAAEAALKFFLVSVVSTAVTLMGVSLLYGVTGSVFLEGLAAATAAGRGPHDVLVVAALLTVVGLAFKVAAVPFHMWVPDVYVGAPVAIAAYLSVVSKAAGFVGLMLVLGLGLPDLTEVWAPLVAVLAAATMTVGNVLALQQHHAVRLLAWSSVAQAGYILVPFGAAHSVDSATDAFAGSLGYLAVYAFVNLGAFAVVAVVGTRHRGQRLSDYRGLVREEPGAGWPLAFALLALAGLPPGIVGLLAKVVVFDAASGVTWLVVVMAVNVAIGLVYYATWLRELFRPAATPGDSTYDVPNGVGAAIGMTFTAGVLFSVLPGWLLDPVMGVLG
jgi:NADH-quinone oxidoreductase subunit N